MGSWIRIRLANADIEKGKSDQKWKKFNTEELKNNLKKLPVLSVLCVQSYFWQQTY
jgi:hypothetical protein